MNDTCARLPGNRRNLADSGDAGLDDSRWNSQGTNGRIRRGRSAKLRSQWRRAVDRSCWSADGSDESVREGCNLVELLLDLLQGGRAVAIRLLGHVDVAEAQATGVAVDDVSHQ